MNALRHPLLSVLLVLQLLYRYSTATVLLLRHGSSVGTHHTKNNNNNNNHVPQQLQQQLPVSKQISKQKRRNIKHKQPKGSKYYHLENDNDDNDNDNNDETVDVDMYNSTTDGKLSIPVSDSNNSTTTSNNTTNTIIVTSPSSSPPTTTTANTTTTSSVDARKSYGSSTATIKKQTMKKNMDPSKKDKLTKTKTMSTTSTGTTGSKGDHPTQSPQSESIDSNVKGDNRSKKGDTNKQMNPKGKKEHTYFVERTRTPTTTAPMIPVVSVPAPSTSVVQPHSNTGHTNRPTKVPTTITTFVPVAYNNSNLTFAPIPPPSTTTNTTTNDTTAVTTTNTNTTTSSSRTNVTTTNARNGDESRHSNSSASVSAAAIVPDTYLDRTTGLFRHTADP